MEETLTKLAECDKARKSAKASIESSERQARKQLCHLKEVEGKLVIVQEKIGELAKELKQKDEAITKAEQAAYNLGQTESEAYLKAQVAIV